MAVAGQHPAQREPHLRRQPDHGAVGPQRGALLFQVSRLSPESFPPACAAWAPPHLGQTRPTEPAACQVPAPWTALSPGAGGAQPDHPPLGGLGVPTSRPVRATTGPPSSCNRPFPKPRWEGPLQGQSRQGGALPGLGLLCTCWQAPPTPRSRTPLRSMVSGYSRASPAPPHPGVTCAVLCLAQTFRASQTSQLLTCQSSAILLKSHILNSEVGRREWGACPKLTGGANPRLQPRGWPSPSTLTASPSGRDRPHPRFTDEESESQRTCWVACPGHSAGQRWSWDRSCLSFYTLYHLALPSGDHF